MEASFSALQKEMTQQLTGLEIKCNDIMVALRAENTALRKELFEAKTGDFSRKPAHTTSIPSNPKHLPSLEKPLSVVSSNKICLDIAGFDDLLDYDAVMSERDIKPPASMQWQGSSEARSQEETSSPRAGNDFEPPVPNNGNEKSEDPLPNNGFEKYEDESSGKELLSTHYPARLPSQAIGRPSPIRPSTMTERPRQSRKSVLRNRNSLESQLLDNLHDNCIVWLSRKLRKKEFDLTVSLLIMINSLVMCVEAQYQGLDVGKDLEYPGRTLSAEDVWPGAQTIFNVLDWMFGILFTIELVLKLSCWRRKYFYDLRRRSEHLGAIQGIQGWNCLDFLCVVAFLTEKLSQASAINPQMLRLLRLFRLWRLVRLLRYLETVDHLYVMTTAIASLGKVLAWAILLLTTMLLTCNLLLVQVLQVTYFNKVTASDLSDEQLDKHHKVYQYFGTCTRCMLSMFEITLGNWPPIARLLSEEVSEWFTLICLFHKLTIGFAVIGVITGVILQETFKVAQTDDIIMYRQKERAGKIMKQKMKTLFDALDESEDGQLEVDEFNAIRDFPEIKTWLASQDIETDDLDTLFSLIDVEDKKYVTLEELVQRMPRIKGTARSIDVLALRSKLQALSFSLQPQKEPQKELDWMKLDSIMTDFDQTCV